MAGGAVPVAILPGEVVLQIVLIQPLGDSNVTYGGTLERGAFLLWMCGRAGVGLPWIVGLPGLASRSEEDFPTT